MFENVNEDWREIPNYPNYMISSLGRVYSKQKDKFLSPDKHGVLLLYNSSGSENWSVQVLMGCIFLGNDMNDPCRNRVLFKDGNSANRCLDNLYIEDTSDLPGEVWKPLKEAVGRPLKDFYQISNMGRIKSIKHYVEFNHPSGSVKKPCPELMVSCTPDDDGYCFAYLACKDGSDVNAQVHRLVAAAFCDNNDSEHKIYVNHIDGNTSNNKAENLEWCTQAENAQHAIRTGLKGNWKGRKLRYPVLHVETKQLYDSISDVERAMGRCKGYCAERLTHGGVTTDQYGNVWTLQIMKNIRIKMNGEGQHCTIDEFPGKEFISLGQASAAIGRWEGYISDALKRGGVIRNKAGQVMHVHLVGDAPVVSANEKYKEKKAAGLIPEKKKRNPLNKTNLSRPLKHVETGIVYRSMSEANRAMGRKDGYLSECFAWNRTPVDKDGNVWTFEVLEQGSVHIHYAKNPCYIDELPGQQFANLTEASLAIGRDGTYIHDRIKQFKPVLSKEGQILHFHYIDPEKEAELQAKYAEAGTQNKPKNKKLFSID